MTHKVGTKGQIVIEKRIRDQLGIAPGSAAFQAVVDDHVEVHFFPPGHTRSLYGILRDSTKVSLSDEELEEAIDNFAGCAIVVSHDRWFLDRVATHILAFEGESQMRWFEGNWTDYEADRRKRLGAAAERPHRIKYRSLTR